MSTAQSTPPNSGGHSIGSTDTTVAGADRTDDFHPREDDLEKGKVEPTNVPNSTADKVQDNDLVKWDGPDDPEFPKNWSDNIKWKYTCTVSLFVFISPVSSSMLAPAMETMAADLGMHTEIETYLSLAIFILAYAVGPVFFGPASELYGRVRILQVTNMWYMAWNLGCGFAQNKAQLLAFRFLAGIGGSAPLAVGGGAIR